MSSSAPTRFITAEGDVAELTMVPINVQDVTREIRSNQAGAIVVFEGTTRDSFQGRTVTRLEYEAYTKLAMKTLGEILTEIRESPSMSGVLHCAVHHRLGHVPVGETSIVVAVASPHRKVAFLACEHVLEQVKMRAQIWKREWYDGDDAQEAQWKENFPIVKGAS